MSQTKEEALARILAYEQANPLEEGSLGWTWSEVKVHASTLNGLLLDDALDIVFKSNSMTGYKLTEHGKAMAGQTVGAAEQLEDDAPIVLPDDLFYPIVGHDDVKRLLRAALSAPKPVHVLQLGPPALSKSIFLWEIERVYGSRALWVVGSATSQAGLWDLIRDREPQVLLVDELDKLRGPDQAAMLSLMEGGRLVRAKAGGRGMDLQIEPTVIAAANRTDSLSPELMSRFAIRRLRPYNASEFREVVQAVLASREGVSDEIAEEIAVALDGQTQDVRDAVRVARLSSSLGVQEAIELLDFPPRVTTQKQLFG